MADNKVPTHRPKEISQVYKQKDFQLAQHSRASFEVAKKMVLSEDITMLVNLAS